MKILIAEDERVSRRLLEAALEGDDYEVVSVDNGVAALELLQSDDPPRIAILDWMMPGLDGVEVCSRVRQALPRGYTYIVLLTSRDHKWDIVAGLESGADDYLTKPFDRQELRSRLAVGRRILRLESALTEKVTELEQALGHVKQLQGLMPICMHCRKIRQDDDSWQRLETYIEQHSDVLFTHALCKQCAQLHYPEFERTGE